MDKFTRAERIAQTKRLKNTRKNYFNVWLKSDPKQLGRIAQYPCMCSCCGCSSTAARRIRGNSLAGLKATEQSFIQLASTEMKGG